jgi:hypothetical protein
MNLSEFLKHGKKLGVIHCDTKEKANLLLSAAEKLGARWQDRENLLCKLNYTSYGISTCYSLHSKFTTYQSCDYYLKKGVTVWKFEHINF